VFVGVEREVGVMRILLDAELRLEGFKDWHEEGGGRDESGLSSGVGVIIFLISVFAVTRGGGLVVGVVVLGVGVVVVVVLVV